MSEENTSGKSTSKKFQVITEVNKIKSLLPKAEMTILKNMYRQLHKLYTDDGVHEPKRIDEKAIEAVENCLNDAPKTLDPTKANAAAITNQAFELIKDRYARNGKTELAAEVMAAASMGYYKELMEKFKDLAEARPVTKFSIER